MTCSTSEVALLLQRFVSLAGEPRDLGLTSRNCTGARLGFRGAAPFGFQRLSGPSLGRFDACSAALLHVRPRARERPS